MTTLGPTIKHEGYVANALLCYDINDKISSLVYESRLEGSIVFVHFTIVRKTFNAEIK
jgi:hypothetical protein